jgi:hypothetical protein
LIVESAFSIDFAETYSWVWDEGVKEYVDGPTFKVLSVSNRLLDMTNALNPFVPMISFRDQSSIFERIFTAYSYLLNIVERLLIMNIESNFS